MIEKKSREKWSAWWCGSTCAVLPLEGTKLGFGQSRWALTTVNLRTLWLTWIKAHPRAAYNISFHFKPGFQSAEWSVNGRIQSAKRAHFQAFPRAAPSGKVQFFIGRQPLNRLGLRLFCWAHVSIKTMFNHSNICLPTADPSLVSLIGWVLLNSSSGIVCQISLCSEGLTRAWCLLKMSAVAAHHGPSPTFQTIELDRACPGSILKDSRHPGGGQKVFPGFLEMHHFCPANRSTHQVLWGRVFSPHFFAVMGKV